MAVSSVVAEVATVASTTRYICPIFQSLEILDSERQIYVHPAHHLLVLWRGYSVISQVLRGLCARTCSF